MSKSSEKACNTLSTEPEPIGSQIGRLPCTTRPPPLFDASPAHLKLVLLPRHRPLRPVRTVSVLLDGLLTVLVPNRTVQALVLRTDHGQHVVGQRCSQRLGVNLAVARHLPRKRHVTYL
mmetsp:Transcript_12271/g.21010  ORF Transcript_12271/g.21010 Transcript_12271/m.21010 type:complete len:119 (+) Transcript_12271:11-367(+)